jgi:hypothetical protein
MATSPNWICSRSGELQDLGTEQAHDFGPQLDRERRAVAPLPVKPGGLPDRLSRWEPTPGFPKRLGTPSHQAAWSLAGDGDPFAATVASL